MTPRDSKGTLCYGPYDVAEPGTPIEAGWGFPSYEARDLYLIEDSLPKTYEGMWDAALNAEVKP